MCWVFTCHDSSLKDDDRVEHLDRTHEMKLVVELVEYPFFFQALTLFLILT